jgi:hypothetical protein
MRPGGRDALRLLLAATACGLVFALLNLPDFRARGPGPSESLLLYPPSTNQAAGNFNSEAGAGLVAG